MFYVLYSHFTLDDAFLEDDAVESTSTQEPPQISPANDPKVGDFVSVKYTLGKKQLIYNAIVIEPCQPLDDRELMVSFLKGQGTYFVFPEKKEVCFVGKEVVVAILQLPLIDNRRRHFF
ncbi:hypothetical protein RRG08_017590 [Elysia crispata]|uniref:Uncharacterized protein n=1 Tax=Elysia crispata TaxID=231223 RepID=A0AAE1CWS8_9GAST|nr:hypothetical protein RRG08_017590 [Elysia crispata]